MGSATDGRHAGPRAARALCLVVDDFGLHAGIAGAALHLAATGRVHAIGCMVGGEAWDIGYRSLVRSGIRAVDLGLHLDLSERPLIGRQHGRLRSLIAASYLRSLDESRLRAEIRAQLDAFENALGRAPDFVDGHQHVHQLPTVRQALLEELCSRYGARRPWLRSTRFAAPDSPAGGQRWPARIKPMLVAALGSRQLAVAARRLGFQSNARLLGMYDFRGGEERYAMLLAGWLAVSGHGDLLMCHPSLARNENDPIGGARLAEYRVLAGSSFGHLIAQQGIELRPMSETLSRHSTTVC